MLALVWSPPWMTSLNEHLQSSFAFICILQCTDVPTLPSMTVGFFHFSYCNDHFHFLTDTNTNSIILASSETGGDYSQQQLSKLFESQYLHRTSHLTVHLILTPIMFIIILITIYLIIIYFIIIITLISPGPHHYSRETPYFHLNSADFKMSSSPNSISHLHSFSSSLSLQF